MTPKIEMMLQAFKDKDYKAQRTPAESITLAKGATAAEYVDAFRSIMEAEAPVLFSEDMFGFNCSTARRMTTTGGNFTPDYPRVLSMGFDALKVQIEENMQRTDDAEKLAYGKAMAECIDLCLASADRYRAAASISGNTRLYNALSRVPHKGATTFYEACVFLKFCAYCLRFGFVCHVGFGRFDQYMYPYYLKDKARGISDDEIFETLEAFFISVNYDTDLYTGIQQGDNGQSMVLGGFDAEGKSQYNALSKMCMRASLELSLIDPKINLRVGKNTPDEIYKFATLLTKQGLGFPQYCNDDVVVLGLIKLGYAPEDAQNYVVAACWEYIVPGCGADIPNLRTMDFPRLVRDTVEAHLLSCATFEALMAQVEKSVAFACDAFVEHGKRRNEPLQPLASVFVAGCIESLTDLWCGGAKYNNFGCHGAGIANAADALAAIKKHIYEERTMTKETLLYALENDFRAFEAEQQFLKSSPKMGNNDAFVDDIAYALMGCFSKHLNNRDNGHGGIWRAGTGSAMEYILKGEKCPATADGRNAYVAYASSFSPSLDVKTTGILSVLQSFTKFDLTEIINGGPLTLEIHDTVLKNDIGIEKTAVLVKQFILLGGHQLQLNSINRERLLDAQKHPENYPNLIVRVWGWSGYFNELDIEYQNHIIRRVAYGV